MRIEPLGTIAIVLAIVGAAQATSPAPLAAPRAEAAAVVRVETAKVCMVTDRLFDKPQIPVDVAGKTYFGCCMMCKERLATDAALRQAVDPVSGRTIDKAAAIPAADAEGRIYYFENEKNLRSFGGVSH